MTAWIFTSRPPGPRPARLPGPQPSSARSRRGPRRRPRARLLELVGCSARSASSASAGRRRTSRSCAARSSSGGLARRPADGRPRGPHQPDPRPNSTEMAMHVGPPARRPGPGLWSPVSPSSCPPRRSCSPSPGLYVTYGAAPTGEALLYGIKPVIIAIVVAGALIAFARTALAGPLAIRRGGHRRPCCGRSASTSCCCLPAAPSRWRRPSRKAIAVRPRRARWRQRPPSHQVNLLTLAGVFLKAGALLYGSGYVLLAFLRGDLVGRLGWLTDAQLLDAVAIGQVTPGPLFTTATFIGYVLAGIPGAIVARSPSSCPRSCSWPSSGRGSPSLRGTAASRRRCSTGSTPPPWASWRRVLQLGVSAIPRSPDRFDRRPRQPRSR